MTGMDRQARSRLLHALLDWSLMVERNCDPLVDAKGTLRSLSEIEGEVIRFALAHCDGNVSEAARCLRIGRSTLYRKLGAKSRPQRLKATAGK